MFTKSDQNLINALIKDGKFYAVYDLLPQYWAQKSKEMIKNMGSKWACHKDNHVKRLDIPLPILNQPIVITKNKSNPKHLGSVTI
jgi:hypothetical protein